MLSAVRDAPNWAAAMDASLALLDWSYGKPQTWFTGGFCEDTSRLAYSAADGFRIFTRVQAGKTKGQSKNVTLHKRHQGMRVGLDEFDRVK
jgi:hypothetical protein